MREWIAALIASWDDDEPDDYNYERADEILALITDAEPVGWIDEGSLARIKEASPGRTKVWFGKHPTSATIKQVPVYLTPVQPEVVAWRLEWWKGGKLIGKELTDSPERAHKHVGPEWEGITYVSQPLGRIEGRE